MRGTWSLVLELFLSTLLHLSHQVNVEGSSSDHYTAAVVEFSPIYKRNDCAATLRANTDAYVAYIEKASQQNADIIVFPEAGLTSMVMIDRSEFEPWTTLVPSADQEYVPCTGNGIDVSETLKRLSCAARENRIYVVVNIAEKRYEGERLRNGTRYHNTNVVFDRTGKVIARYRKVNLYIEPNFDRPETPEIVTFDTDFGVRFGTFICFDMLFSEPALNLTRKEGVSNIVYPTGWYSELPFLTAVQTHFGWSYAENANVLVAGYHNAKVGNVGSGIYLGRNGIANATMSSDTPNRLLIARVPKTTAEPEPESEPKPKPEPKPKSKPKSKSEPKPESESNAQTDLRCHERSAPFLADKIFDGICFMRENVTWFHTVPLTDSATDTTLCHENFCCDFHVRTTNTNDHGSSPSNYRAVVYNGTRFFSSIVEAGVRLCGLIRCASDSIDSCGFVGESDVVFTALNVTARFDDYSDILVIPSVLDSSLLPFEQWTYTERPNEKQTSLTLALNEPTTNLVAFGMYARNFAKDKWNRPISSP